MDTGPHQEYHQIHVFSSLFLFKQFFRIQLTPKSFPSEKKAPPLLLASSLPSTSKFEQAAAALRAPATAEAVRHILVRFILLQYVAQVVIRE